MSILTASNLGQAFGALDVFSGISVSIANDARIGLVGPNGIGKSSLLRILAGVAQPSTGEVHWSRGSQVGYLRQEAVQTFAEQVHTVYEEMLTVFTALRAQQERLREMEAHMSHSSSAALVEAYGTAQEAFERAGGYTYEVQIRQVLAGLGFTPEQWKMSVGHLSGGQKTRVLLARLLLEAPDLLILDEPTNHLDVEAIEWLENRLRSWEGALLVVSHDRYFLNKVVNRIWEMSANHLESYRGNYSAYVQQREERWTRNEQVVKREKEHLLKELDFIRRHIAGQNTDIAMGKLKRLSRRIVAIEELGWLGKLGKNWLEMGLGRVRPFSVAEAHQRIHALRGPTRPPKLHMRLETPHRSGHIVLQSQALKIGYPAPPPPTPPPILGEGSSSLELFSSDDIELERESYAALIGPNGSGKTTFLRTLLGEQEALAGDLTLGYNVHLGYFSQAHDNLDPNKSVLDELLSQYFMLTPDAQSHLAQYLFRGDEIYRSVGALSGGERGRLALAILALQQANLLLLDEPTNHLDIPSQEILQDALENFTGTILLVSHDRYLVDRLATEIWELRDGHLHIFKGGYQEFLAAREREREAEKEAAEAAKHPTHEETPLSDGPRQLSKNEAYRRAQALAEIENKITKLEEKLEAYSQQLQQASEAQDFDAIQEASDGYAETEAQLEGLWEAWEELAE